MSKRFGTLNRIKERKKYQRKVNSPNRTNKVYPVAADDAETNNPP